MRDTAASSKQKSPDGNMFQGWQAQNPRRGRGKEETLEGETWVEKTLIYSVSEAQLPGFVSRKLYWFPLR